MGETFTMSGFMKFILLLLFVLFLEFSFHLTIFLLLLFGHFKFPSNDLKNSYNTLYYVNRLY